MASLLATYPVTAAPNGTMQEVLYAAAWIVDPKLIHVVNRVIELPEGAILSDTEDKNNADPNDPHRAPDIHLDAPFDEVKIGQYHTASRYDAVTGWRR
ncbi:uncharacterized protein LOC125766928 isoform X3 [Anopheles funestus]|uniref:uncharacterized protein LOC125766928 isoform X3 n=1 Tax=Anopheles funestus TaxID=62324 RepID=UPI0020C6FA72|nr:uncharacterized protein LOC125766928 isoform X3 [Anopheles funestus]